MKVPLSKITDAGIDAARLLRYVSKEEKGLSHAAIGTLLVGGNDDQHNVGFQLVSKSAPNSLPKALASADPPSFLVNLTTTTVDALRAFYETYVVDGAPLPPTVTPKNAAPSAQVASPTISGGPPVTTPAPATPVSTVANPTTPVEPSILDAVGATFKALVQDAIAPPVAPADLVTILYGAIPADIMATETPRIIVGALATAAGNRPPVIEKVIQGLAVEVQEAFLASLRENAPDAVANTVDDLTRRVFHLNLIAGNLMPRTWDDAVNTAALDGVDDLFAVPTEEALTVARKKNAVNVLRKLGTGLQTEINVAKTAAEARLRAQAEADRASGVVTPVKVEWSTVADLLASALPKEYVEVVASMWPALEVPKQQEIIAKAHAALAVKNGTAQTPALPAPAENAKKA